MRNRRGAMIVSFPKTLKVFVIALLSSQLEIPSITFKNCDNLREVRLVDITYVLMTGSIKGCENLCLFDISRSFVRIETKQNPVRHFPNLSVLKMNSLQNAHDVMNKFTQNRWTENLSFLQEVQLSNNVLRSLPSDLFKNNINLKRLRLSGNRFSSVPVQVTTTAALEHLDLMDNSIVSLDTRTMRSLDEHVLTVPTFSVVLQGNTINCACSEITFLVWLHTTLVNLDDPEQYRCINDRGVVTKLGNLQSAKAIWRRCVGREALLTSLFLAACITIGFLSVYLVRRFKTALQVFILRMVTPGFRMKGPRDYGNDVFIGYADDDFRFVRYVLRRHLEEELGVSTYIHQRDNRGGYFDDQIVDAVGDSWRLILLLSDNFLRHYSKAHLTMKLCAAAPSPVNPESVMVLLEEGQGRHVPDYLMAVVDEDRVVRLDPQAQRLTYEQKQKIRHWLSE
ncbi:toll-like receptor 4 [Aplysia californica]|uniref:Toll-like receptor 4 n=1 Tax=Aplysia californica TaxID=6500 RepID=A0ABM0JZ00_APLCA|nr:toll-like receptor 4 [Aplysia californica]